ncbi:MAG: response regulator transcription factor [Acidimicrobiales bacterium]
MGAPTVLVVDDDPVILQLLKVNFELEGFSVVTATDGVEGLARVQDSAPDIVLTDIMMPRLDGLALVGALRENDATRRLPVILLSAKAQSADVERGIAMGADDYVTKPFDPIELVDRVNAVLAKPRR